MKKLVRKIMLLGIMLAGLGFIVTGNISSVKADPYCPENCFETCDARYTQCFTECSMQSGGTDEVDCEFSCRYRTADCYNYCDWVCGGGRPIRGGN